MRRLILTPSSMPVSPSPGPLLVFIQQAQLAMVYAPGGGSSPQQRLRTVIRSQPALRRLDR